MKMPCGMILKFLMALVAHQAAASTASMRGALPQGVQRVDVEDWLRQCAQKVKVHGFGDQLVSTHYSTYYLIAEPSGLCANSLSCAFEQCYWTNASKQALMIHDLHQTHMSDLLENLPPLNLPNSVALPKSVKDLVEAVKYAARLKMGISVKTSGHSYTGSSTMKGSLLVNLRSFPKYSSTSVVDCVSSPSDAEACKLALARKKGAVVRVGGGELWDDVYRAVMDWNGAVPRKRKFQNFGGGAGTVSAAGGWLQGGGLGLGMERLWGIGVDQVLQLEMVLPNGTHVKFGPTAWRISAPFLYPQTTKVEGQCNYNVHEDEAQWDWRPCEREIAFDQLWFAVRGGGGGTFGVVTAVHYQLHDLENWYAVETIPSSMDALLAKCTNLTQSASLHCDTVDRLWLDFAISFLYDPSSLGVDAETSNRCGESNPAFSLRRGERVLWCMGSAAERMIRSWQQFVNGSSVPEDMLPDLLALLVPVNKHSYGFNALQNGLTVDWVPKGHMPDDDGAATVPLPSGTWSSMFPVAWILQRSPEVYATLLPLAQADAKLHIMGGNVALASDGMTAISKVEREAAFQTSILTDMASPKISAWASSLKLPSEASLRKLFLPYVVNGTQFLGGTEYNHISADVVGPLKTNFAEPCPSDYSVEQRQAQCLSLQESVWGTEMLAKLEAIKEGVDPDSLLSCYFCVGNRRVPSKRRSDL